MKSGRPEAIALARPLSDSPGESEDALMSGCPAPAQGHRNIAINLRKVEGHQMFADRERKSIGVDDILAHVRGLDDLQIPAR